MVVGNEGRTIARTRLVSGLRKVIKVMGSILLCKIEMVSSKDIDMEALYGLWSVVSMGLDALRGTASTGVAISCQPLRYEHRTVKQCFFICGTLKV